MDPLRYTEGSGGYRLLLHKDVDFKQEGYKTMQPHDLQLDYTELELDRRFEEALTGGSSKYYELPEGVEEIQDLIEAKGMSFSQGNIFKACWRMSSKVGTTRKYDLEKIIWFAERMLKEEVNDGRPRFL